MVLGVYSLMVSYRSEEYTSCAKLSFKHLVSGLVPRAQQAVVVVVVVAHESEGKNEKMLTWCLIYSHAKTSAV